MAEVPKPLYVPALRMKTGELSGLRDLAPDIAAFVLPRLVVPPHNDRDDELDRELLRGEGVPAIAPILSRYWQNRDVLVEPTYLVDDFGADTIDLWLPKMFDMARDSAVRAVPLLALDDLWTFGPAAKLAIGRHYSLKLAVRIPSGEMVGPGWREKLLHCLTHVGLSPSECCILADFCDADFSQPELVAGVIQGALETLQDIGLWRQIVFQGTNFPEKNPADHGSSKLVPRNEWDAWRRAVQFAASTDEHMVFGDYAADCANFAFGVGGGRAIRHYRYATPTDWLIERGAETGSDTQVMRTVCKKIVDNPHFAGRKFSFGDDFIYMTAVGAGGPGNSTTWRAVNTNHHITRVVSDIGAVRDIEFAERAVETVETRELLFPVK